MLYSLCFISNSVRLLQDDELEAFLAISKVHNLVRNITGILLYNEGTFLEVMEGEYDDVLVLISKISRDPRHNQITVMMDQEISNRLFESFQTGILSSDNKVKNEILKFKKQLPKASQYAKSLRTLLNSFTSHEIIYSGYGV
ncbi:MAG: BLUF domain-containing protein [Flavobacteriaceae bacterium]|nr:BLUF domain-containing protein [Flavobacteriaceae bacterium]